MPKKVEAIYTDARESNAYERLSEISVPTLIITGAEDERQLHRSADKQEQDIKGSKRATISETHHMPNMEKPEEFNRIVLDFLAEQDLEATEQQEWEQIINKPTVQQKLLELADEAGKTEEGGFAL